MNKITREALLFNTPLEVGLRCLILLVALEEPCDLQRLIYYDYFLVHYGDIDDNYQSLHPDTPYRSGEVLIKRKIVSRGILLMCKKQLIDVEFNKKGIVYKTTELSNRFLSYFESNYVKKLKEYSQLVITNFSSYSDKDLRNYVSNNLERWGGEFSKEALFRGAIYE